MSNRFAGTTLELLVMAGLVLSGTGLPAQSVPGQIQVRGLIGSATYSTAGSTPVPLQTGASVPVGAVVKTDTGAAVDLSFSNNAGVVRLLQNSTLSLDKFMVTTGNPGTVEVQLYLMDGTMVGFDKKLPGASRYQIKVANGIADISGSKYRISAQGYVVLLDGNGVFVFVPPGGEPVPFELRATSPVYFSPVEGVKSAPAELVREVNLQTKGKLHK